MRSVFVMMVLATAADGGFASSNSLLSVSSDGERLLTANRDNGSVTVVDLNGRRVLREIKIGGKQTESVAWIGSGPNAAATSYRDNEVVVIDTGTGEILQRIATPPEPYGVVVDKPGRFAYVTCEYPGVVCEIDLSKNEVVRELKVGPWARGIAFAADQKKLLVTHYYSGTVSAVDRKTGQVLDVWEGGRSDNLSRQIAVHPTLPLAYAPMIRSKTQRAHGAGSIFPYVMVLELDASADEKRRHVIPMDSFFGVYVVANPWETAISPDGKRCYTVFAGTNDMYIADVLDDGYRFLSPVFRPVRLGNNPRAVAVTPDSQTVVVYNTLDFAVTLYDAKTMRRTGEVRVCDNPFTKDVLRGKILFNVAQQPMSARRWISCSSCHPDGDHDGRTWQNPEGLRRTTHFFGMKRTHPIHWSADRDEVQDFEFTIRGPLMQGRGLVAGKLNDALGERNAGLSKDLDALADYCNTFEHVLSPYAAGPGRLTEAAQRGKELFFSEKTQCASCHSGLDYTDRTVHDVGTGRGDPSEKMGTKYDTPTLLRTYRNTEYFHDGSAKSLREVLTTANPKDLHGRTNHLSDQQIDDLVAFLKSLPYEVGE